MVQAVLVQKKSAPPRLCQRRDAADPALRDALPGGVAAALRPLRRAGLSLVVILYCLASPALPASAPDSARLPIIPKWDRFEANFRSSKSYRNPIQQAALTVTFVSPRGETNMVPGFWDGGRTWRVRFCPGEPGRWTYRTTCSDPANKGLANRTGAFTCTDAGDAGRTNRFDLHGPVRLTADRRRFEHADGTTFFWLADAAWQGGRASELKDWQIYAGIRAVQKFSAVQWIAVAAGSGRKQPAFSGHERIAVKVDYFKRLDAKVDALNRAGLLSVIAPLWEVDVPAANALPEDQAALLLRHMAARWSANEVAWLLAFDGGSVPQNIGRWKRIGRAIFGEGARAPVILFPGETTWVFDEFRDETWVDAFGFGMGRNYDDDWVKWLISGPLAVEWKKEPVRPLLLVSPPLEDSVTSGQLRISPDEVRRALWWSLLLAPPAGVSYGAEAVANWNPVVEKRTDSPLSSGLGQSRREQAPASARLATGDALREPQGGASRGRGMRAVGNGSSTPAGNRGAQRTDAPHPGGDVESDSLTHNLPRWRKSLFLAGARQIERIAELPELLDLFSLVPDTRAVAVQPGVESPRRTISAAATLSRDACLAYVPEERTVVLQLGALPPSPVATWTSPRTGETHPAVAAVVGRTCRFPTPAPGDWLLTIRSAK
jgi:hypothetical protein